MSLYPDPGAQYSSAYPVATSAPQQSAENALEQLRPMEEQQSYGAAPMDTSLAALQATIARLRQEDEMRAAESASNGDPSPQEEPSPQGEPSQQEASASGPATETTPRPNRLRKACDSCSIRKVKCDESGPPCRACANLDIPCTFERPSRRRGPPNRHAEEIKRRRLEAESGLLDSPSSPTHAAQALAALSAAQQQNFTAESISSLDVVDRLLTDFFAYVHPVAPFPHEPMFMQAFRRRDDVHNKFFTAMIAAMVGTVVVAYPKRLRAHSASVGVPVRQHNAESFVQNCVHICTNARGAGYLDRGDDQINTYDAITSYFLGQIYAQRGQLHQGGRYFAEALTILRSCGLQSPESSLKENNVLNDFVHQELAKRLYWRLLIDLEVMRQLNITCPELEIAYSYQAAPRPSLPIERDDAYVFSNSYDPQPSETTSELTGFNLYLRLFQEYSALQDLDSFALPDSNSDSTRLKALIAQGLEKVKQVPSLPEPPNNAYQQLTEYLNGRNESGVEEARDEQRAIHSVVQRALLEMGSISTRFDLVEAFWRIDDAQGSEVESQDERAKLQLQMKEERVVIVDDLVRLLSRVSQTMIEFGLDYFTDQAKRLSNALIQRQAERKAMTMTSETGWLTRILKVLERAQRVATQADGTFGDEYEEATWADFRLIQQESPSMAA